MMALGIFVLLISFWAAGGRTMIAYMTLARWFALFAFVGNLVPYAHTGSRLGMERLEWFLFNLLAVGPFTLSLLLWMNFLLHGAEVYAATTYEGDIMELRTFWMDHETLPPTMPVEAQIAERLLTNPPAGFIGGHLIGTSKGLFGYEVITTYEEFLVPER